MVIKDYHREKARRGQWKAQSLELFVHNFCVYLRAVYHLVRGRYISILEDHTGGHEILNVLSEHLVLCLQTKILLLDRIHFAG